MDRADHGALGVLGKGAICLPLTVETRQLVSALAHNTSIPVCLTLQLDAVDQGSEHAWVTRFLPPVVALIVLLELRVVVWWVVERAVEGSMNLLLLVGAAAEVLAHL